MSRALQVKSGESNNLIREPLVWKLWELIRALIWREELVCFLNGAKVRTGAPKTGTKRLINLAHTYMFSRNLVMECLII